MDTSDQSKQIAIGELRESNRTELYVHMRLLFTLALFATTSAFAQPAKHGEVLPAGEVQAKYELIAENYQPEKLNPANVPSDLRDLLPLAQKWGIGDDIIRDDFQRKAARAEKQALAAALKGRNKRITQWLDSHAEPMSAEAAAFMYMQRTLDELKLWED